MSGQDCLPLPKLGVAQSSQSVGSGPRRPLERIQPPRPITNNPPRDTRNTILLTSAGNSTTTPLGAGEVFTGVMEKTDDHAAIIQVKTDADGVCVVQFSWDDGVTWDSSLSFNVTAGIPEYHRVIKNNRWFRVVYTNGSDVQSYIRLSVDYGDFALTNAPINLTAGLDADAIVTRPTDHQEEISLGRRAGVTAWSKFGHRSLLAAGGDETIWNTTGNYVPPVAATGMTVTYDGTGGGSTDGAGTTGATELTISYIDSAGLPAVYVHTLGTDGSDAIATTTLGINRVKVTGAGAIQCNASDITIPATTGGAKLALVEAASGVTQQCIFHVGSNHDFLTSYLYLHINKTGGGSSSVQIKGYVFDRTTATKTEVFRTTLDDTVETTEDLNLGVPIKVPATGVLYFTADTTRDSVEAVVRFSGNEYQRS